MKELISWMKEYSPPIVLAFVALAALIFVLRKVVEQAIEVNFERAKKEAELSLLRRSAFWDKVLVERYSLISSLVARLEKVSTNLNRLRQNKPIPPGFMVENEVHPLTEIFEDIKIHRLLLGEHYYDLFFRLASLTLSLANSNESKFDDIYRQTDTLQTQLRKAVDLDFHISTISFNTK